MGNLTPAEQELQNAKHEKAAINEAISSMVSDESDAAHLAVMGRLFVEASIKEWKAFEVFTAEKLETSRNAP